MENNDFFTTIAKKIPARIGPTTILIAFAYVEAIIIYIINYLGPNYSGIIFFVEDFTYILPLTFLLYCISLYIEDQLPREAAFLESIWLFNNVVVVMATFVGAIQLTPFAPVNELLHKIDLALGFNESTVISWTYAHPLLYQIFYYAYGLLSIELMLIPLILIISLQHRSMRVYILSLLISAITGMTFYHFFPSNGPAAVLHNPHFLEQMYWASERFQAMQAHLPVLQSTRAGGLIAFPSYHVIWCVLMVYAVKNIKPLFYFFLVINITIILSTMGLGWHFLTDVLGGIALAIASIYLAEKLYKKSFPKEPKFKQFHLWGSPDT